MACNLAIILPKSNLSSCFCTFDNKHHHSVAATSVQRRTAEIISQQPVTLARSSFARYNRTSEACKVFLPIQAGTNRTHAGSQRPCGQHNSQGTAGCKLVLQYQACTNALLALLKFLKLRPSLDAQNANW